MIEEVLREEGTETMTAPIALPQEGSSAVESQEQQIKTTWTALQVAEGQLEKRGLAFGKALYDFRAASEVVQGGTTFRSTLDKLTIPHSTAYVWIDKYAASIGMKKLNKERHPHRGETKSFDPIGANALEIVQAGYATLLDKGEKSPRELQAAKDWTYARLKGQNIATTPSPLATVHTSEGDKSYNYFEQFKEEPQTMGDEIVSMLIEFKLDQHQIKEVLRYAEMSATRTLQQLKVSAAA